MAQPRRIENKPAKTITLKTLPLSTNRLYRGRRFLTQEAKSNKEIMGWEMKTAWGGKPMKGAVRLKIALYWPDNRRHDLDNVKGMIDSWTGIFYEDDSQITELHLSKNVDKDNPRIEVSLYD